MTASAPPRLVPRQTIGIPAPAGPVNVDYFRRGLARLGDTFRIAIADSVLAPRAAGVPSYLSASDEVRAAELSAMLADPDIRAIVLARGGYGILRILPRLDPELLRRDPKPIVGFSDATALLAWAHAAGVRGIHGPTVQQLAELDDADVARFTAALSEPRALGERPWPLVVHDRAGGGIRRGPLVPANLTLASMLVGTPWALPLAGAIAMFEEVGERPYELDRYLSQLALTGALRGVGAVVLGDLVRCVDREPPAGGVDPADAALHTIVERLAAAGVAAASGAPIGHGTRNEAVPFGAACELDLDRGAIAITEAAVA